ncbi:MAG: hypothetical protein ACOX4Q_10645 [Syntrophomonadales bacterium]
MEAAVRDLIENLGRQEGTYQNMRVLARQQLEAAADPVGSEFDEDVVLKEKAELVEDLQLLTARARLLERDLAQRFGMPEFTLKGMSGNVSDELYQSLAEAFARLGGVLKDIADLDARDYPADELATVHLPGSSSPACEHCASRPGVP